MVGKITHFKKINMVKILLSSILLLINCHYSYSQVVESEKIDWENLPAFTATHFTLNTGKINYDCKDCRYVTLTSNSGVSGYLLIGQASFSIPKKKIEGKSTAIMIRLNPKDSLDFLKIENPTKIEDNGFVAFSLLILNNIFKRCYHSGMDALIPNKGEYTVDLFSDQEGDLLVAFADDEVQLFNVSKRKKK